MQTVRCRHQPLTHLDESESESVDVVETLVVLDGLCCGLSEVIESEKSKSTDQDNSNETDLFSLTRRCGFALARIEKAVLDVEKRVGGQRNADTKTKEVQHQVGGMIVRHFRSSIQSPPEKEIGSIGIDLAALRREMEAEREKEKETARKAEEERQREFSRKMREMEEMKRMNEKWIEEGRQREEEKKREEERQREEERKRNEEEERRRMKKEGAAAIELFARNKFTLSGNVFTKTFSDLSSLFSLSFGPVVVRFTFVIKKWVTNNFQLGLISTDLVEQAKQIQNFFSSLKRAASWELYPSHRYAHQNCLQSHAGSACKAGASGQRVVLEADGREGKRTLKLSQDGETQPVFFSNIPVPFRFAIQMWATNASVEIVSTEVLREPSMVGGSLEVVLD
ncbi:hypothetical protein BLNAU_18263 [Blattamonas nauphoetae]|uniref:Uncharacterized protein n=1 Tax=Blattamonas nauphoetae TaxID=2049346 RepID=A0ABQ9X4W9_9EUKA|nr:hypothetical protein BLNAU_18263 [Blattamonas nauphoetae]